MESGRVIEEPDDTFLRVSKNALTNFDSIQEHFPSVTSSIARRVDMVVFHVQPL